MAAVPVLALNIHAGFECRHSGSCCSAGWPIPVEAGVVAAMGPNGTLPPGALRTDGLLPDGAAAVLQPAADGACPLFDRTGGNLCMIQRRLGHDALPASCRHFPRVALLETDAVRVTLSHFCPTAASMLFRPEVGTLSIVADAAGIADRVEHDGFDARQTIPPLLRPGVAMDAPTCRLWEQYLLSTFGSAGLTPETMLASVAATAEDIRGWTPGRECLESHARKAAAAAGRPSRQQNGWTMPLASASRLFLLATGSVVPGLARPAVPSAAEDGDRSWVLPRWPLLARPLGRYLAARSFGAWSAYVGEGLRTQAAMLAVALAAVRIEAVRETMNASRPLDERLLHAAIRSADLLLHHLSDTTALVRSLAGCEHGPPAAWLAFAGLETVR